MQVKGQQLLIPVPEPPPGVQWLSNRCCIQRVDGMGAVIIEGLVMLRFSMDDLVETRLAASMIANSKAASVGAVLEAFGMDDATLWRARRDLREGGVAALFPMKRGRKAVEITDRISKRIVVWREAGVSQMAIAERLGLSRWHVRRVLDRQGEDATETVQQRLPLETERAHQEPEETTDAQAGVVDGVEALVASIAGSDASDTQACTVPDQTESEESLPQKPDAVVRGVSRAESQEMAVAYAMLGMAQDCEAEVVFEPRETVANAGVLLAIPALEATGVLKAARRVYGRLKNGIYGLRATLLVLSTLAFLRRPRPEALKEKDPVTLGDVLGLARVPEVKTLRRKLTEIAGAGRTHELVQEVGKTWLEERSDTLGVLYVDGHVRVYHGKRRLPKTHVAQRNQSMPATTDYWVNDVLGQPVFVATAEANAAMTKVLPTLLEEIEEVGDLPNQPDIKGTVVFDRGGWSQKLFKELIQERGWDILTYRKGKRRKHPRKGFEVQRMTIDGRSVEYTLSERRVRLCKGLVLREIAELREDGGQTIFLTSHFDHPAVLLAHTMFGRWKQENYFSYMKENFELDALVDYGVVPADPTREVPNPAHKAMTKKLKEARSELAALERAYGSAAADNEESVRPTMRGFKIANGETGQALRVAREKVEKLKLKRRQLPKRVPVSDALKGDPVIRLTLERKVFTDVIKAAAYRAETTLLNLLRPHYSRSEDEGRAFLRQAVCQSGGLEVNGNDVVVRLAPMSAPRYTAALRALCDELNRLEPGFPETTYRLRYEVASRVIEA